MADDPDVLAKSMHTMYGPGALDVAKGYVQKHLRSGDVENHAIWLRVVDLIAEKQRGVLD